MLKKNFIVSLCLSVFGLTFANAPAYSKALIFKGTDPQQQEQVVTNQYEGQRNSVEGIYALSNVGDVKSQLMLKPDGSFSWYMIYKKTNLATNGYWKIDENDSSLIELNTNPYPEDIPFIYKGIIPPENIRNTVLPEGSVQMQIGYYSENEILPSSPLKNIVVVCEGVLKKQTVETNQNGLAVCKGTGLPLKKLTIYNKDLPNRTEFIAPQFKGRSWVFSFDYLNAHTDYAFVQEKMKFNSDGTITWYPNSLKANSIWTYKQNIN